MKTIFCKFKNILIKLNNYISLSIKVIIFFYNIFIILKIQYSIQYSQKIVSTFKEN